jgi:hypothetical protein
VKETDVYCFMVLKSPGREHNKSCPPLPSLFCNLFGQEATPLNGTDVFCFSDVEKPKSFFLVPFFPSLHRSVCRQLAEKREDIERHSSQLSLLPILLVDIPGKEGQGFLPWCRQWSQNQSRHCFIIKWV